MTTRSLSSSLVCRLVHLAVVAAALPGAAACRGGEAAPTPPAGPPPAPVQLATLQEVPVAETTEYVATLRAIRSTSVKPQVDGHVRRIFVTSGDRVAAGAPLVLIDPDRQRAAVESAEAALAARRADLDYARQQLARMKDLFAQRVVSQAELDQAETAVKTAEAALEAASAQLRQGRVQLEYYQVVAPTAGIVGDIPVRVGDRVTPDTELTTVDSNDRLELYIPVPGERAGALKPGLPVQVLDDGDGSPLAEVAISFVSPRVDPDTQTVLAKAVVANPGGRLRSNQFVRARITWATRPGLVVPVLAVLRLNGQPFVFVAEEQQGQLVARQRAVRLGPITGDRYTVVEGLAPGDRVVVSGVQRLGDGAPIQAQG
jgi:RND family efflux transporter MFP subunit